MSWGQSGRALFPLLLFLMAFVSVAWAETTMSADEFTRFYAARVEKLFPGARIDIQQALEVKIRMRPESEAAFTTYLDNAFKRYLDEPTSIEEILNQYTRILANDFDDAPFAKREQFVAVIRHESYIDSLKNNKRADQVVPGRKLAGDIYVFYAFDAPDTTRYADLRATEKAGLKESEFDSVAIQNLRRIMVEPVIETYPQMIVISSGDPYMTSALLIDQFWSPERFRFRGDLVVFVVARDLMLVTGSGEQEGLEAASKAARALVDHVPYAISAEPIVRRHGKWQSFVQ